MPQEKQTPGRILTSLMEKYNLNPCSLGKRLGISHSSIRLYMADKGKISVETALKLAKCFDTSPGLWLDLQRSFDLKEAVQNKELQKVLYSIQKVQNSGTKPKSGHKTLSEKRKAASTVPGAKGPRNRKK